MSWSALVWTVKKLRNSSLMNTALSYRHRYLPLIASLMLTLKTNTSIYFADKRFGQFQHVGALSGDNNFAYHSRYCLAKDTKVITKKTAVC